MLGTYGGVEETEFLPAHVHHKALDLQGPPNEEERAPRDEQRLLLEPLRCHDDVDQPGLVLEREEDEPLGGAGPLAADDETGDEDGIAIAGSGSAMTSAARRQERSGHCAGARHPAAHLLPQMRHRVTVE